MNTRRNPGATGASAMALAILLAACTTTPCRPTDPHALSAIIPAVERTLDALHDAASKADAARYWSCFAPGAVFLGTDATERWTLDQFKNYADPLFATGRGWTYTLLDRHVTSGGTPECFGRYAWFDERLMNAKYGECRGSGVLILDDARGWLIAQYNLTVPIPNDLLPEVAERIRAVAPASRR